jgi:glycosyltransferase involved in cell wall biosynthesis
MLYVEGPGDIVAAFESWRAREEHASETSITYSSQVFAHCQEQGLSLMALSYCSRPASAGGPGMVVENLPRRMLRIPKIGYHLSLLWYACRIGARIMRHRPRLVLLTSGVISWNFAAALRWTGATVVPVLHNALWPEGFRPRRPSDVALWRSRRPPFTLAVSAAIRRQVASIDAGAAGRVIEFRPTVVESEFAVPPYADPGSRPFCIIFVGRLELDKGALDLVEIAAALEAAEPGAFRIEVCGSGSQAQALADAIAERGLQSMVKTWGRLDRTALIGRYVAAHVCIVPTRSNFSEGFAQVVSESILLRRPVVTSQVVPASEPYASAIAMAVTDDVASYVAAILSLAHDAQAYTRLAEACTELRPLIFDRTLSFQNALQALGQRSAAEVAGQP